MLELKMVALLTIAGSSLIAGSSIAYYYGYALPKKEQAVLALQQSKQKVTPTPNPIATLTPTVSPSATPIPTISQWTFRNTQYVVTLSNVTYPQPTPTPITCNKATTGDDLEQKIQCLEQQARQQHDSNSSINADLTIKNVSIKPFMADFKISDCSTNNTNFQASFSSQSLQKGILPNETATVHIAGGVSGVAYDASGNKVNPPADLKVSSCKIAPSTINGATIEPKTIQFNQ